MINDGIHYNRWQRNQQLKDALQQIIQERNINIPVFLADYKAGINYSDPARKLAANAVIHELQDELIKRTGCKLATARGHVFAWIRSLKPWGSE